MEIGEGGFSFAYRSAREMQTTKQQGLSELVEKTGPFLMNYVNLSILVDFSGLQLSLRQDDLLVAFNNWPVCSFSDSVPVSSIDSFLPTRNQRILDLLCTIPSLYRLAVGLPCYQQKYYLEPCEHPTLLQPLPASHSYFKWAQLAILVVRTVCPFAMFSCLL